MVPDQDIEVPAESSHQITGVVALADGLLLIQDVDAMLSDDEERVLDQSIAGEEA